MEPATPLWSAVNLSVALCLTQNPVTLPEVAAACRLVPAEALLRLTLLKDQGLVVEAHNGEEAVYSPAFRSIDLTYRDTGDADENAQQMETLIRQTRRDLLLQALDGQGGAHVRLMAVPMSAGRFQQWLDRLQELEREFAPEEEDTDSWHLLTVAAYPQPTRK